MALFKGLLTIAKQPMTSSTPQGFEPVGAHPQIKIVMGGTNVSFPAHHS